MVQSGNKNLAVSFGTLCLSIVTQISPDDWEGRLFLLVLVSVI